MITIEIHDTKYGFAGTAVEIVTLPGRMTGRIYRDVIVSNINQAVNAGKYGFRRIDATIHEDGHLTGFVSRSVGFVDNGEKLFDIQRWNYRGRVIENRR